MNILLLLLGPNGVGKSTAARSIMELLRGSAVIDTDHLRLFNPSDFSEAAIDLQKKNILSLARNAWDSGFIHTVIIPYGLHGHRAAMLEDMVNTLCVAYPLRVVTFVLTCDEDENIRRMQADGRDDARIRRALETSRPMYDGLDYPVVDTTRMTPAETASVIVRLLEREGSGG